MPAELDALHLHKSKAMNFAGSGIFNQLYTKLLHNESDTRTPRADCQNDFCHGVPTLRHQGREKRQDQGRAAPGHRMVDRVLIDEKVTFKTFFDRARLHPNAELITGVICGYRIEELDNRLTREVRYLDKLVDELARGRKMEKILRKPKG